MIYIVPELHEKALFYVTKQRCVELLFRVPGHIICVPDVRGHYSTLRMRFSMTMKPSGVFSNRFENLTNLKRDLIIFSEK